MIMVTCLIAWMNQYNLTHKTLPKSPRTLLLDLENIEKVFVNKYNEKAKANKTKAAKASKADEACVPRKRTNGGVSDQVPKRGRSIKYCRWCKANGGPHTNHDMVKCHKYEKDGILKDKSA
jgi:hypothetical protein